jgi:chromosome segregation ATPase
MSNPTAPSPLQDDGVLGQMVDELLSNVAPVPREECDAHRRRIDELEAIVRMKENRIAEIEADRAQDGKLREELEASRARLTLFADWVARLSRERDQFAEMARAARDESQRLSGEVARLQQCLEALKRLGR